MLKKFLFAMIGLSLLTVVIGACSIKDTGGAPTGPVVKMGPSTFLQAKIDVPKGQTLTLQNPSSQSHVISNGTWAGATPKAGAEPNAPKAQNVSVQVGGSMELGPFTTAGTFEYFCTI
ncbi:MAG: hypothetical protein J2P36_37995, partial [Ktedonobacteraceae bacterium]|nr:hypothetical protein [Ktedonobacteraceae bacterium]